jgi:hypothetical protein
MISAPSQICLILGAGANAPGGRIDPAKTAALGQLVRDR